MPSKKITSKDGTFEVFHYTQSTWPTRPAKSPLKPLSTPRRVPFTTPVISDGTQGIPGPAQGFELHSGLQLIEMGRVQANAFCCGGGGGNFFTDLLGSGPESPARAGFARPRSRGRVLAVACPNCAKMLEDAAKAEDLEETLRVMDLAEIAGLAG